MKALDVPTNEMRSPAEIARLDAFPKICAKTRVKANNDDDGKDKVKVTQATTTYQIPKAMPKAGKQDKTRHVM